MNGRALVALTALVVCTVLAGCGQDMDRRAADKEVVSTVGIRDKLKKRAKHDEQSIRQMLEAEGATAAQAREIVQTLSGRLTPDQMHVWLSHPEKSHPVPDPEASKQFEDAGLVPVVMNWTPVNAISAGKTELVIAEAKRFAAQN